MEKDGIIEPVPHDELCEWISPALFVPKDGAKGIRLVTDYTCLNKYVRRPVQPFPSAGDITKSILPGARWFCKLDAVLGYHQLPSPRKPAGSLPSYSPGESIDMKEAQWGSLPQATAGVNVLITLYKACLLYTSPSPRDKRQSRMPSSA